MQAWFGNPAIYCSKDCYDNDPLSFQRTHIAENALQWKAEGAGYSAKHKWVVHLFGKAKFCEHCGKVGEKINGRWNIDWANIDHTYHRNPEEYIGLCQRCHFQYDKVQGYRKNLIDYRYPPKKAEKIN